MSRLRCVIAVAAAASMAVAADAGARARYGEPTVASIEVENPTPQLSGDAPVDNSAQTPAREASPTAGNPLWAIPIETLSATRDRPLFSASRRPPPPVVAAAPAAPPAAEPVKSAAPEKPPFTLVGTIIGDNRKIAIFFNEASKATTSVQEGQRESGWILRSVGARSTVLESSGRTVTLDLPEPSGQGGRTVVQSSAELVRRNEFRK